MKFPVPLFVLVFFAACGLCSAAPATNRPNVIVIYTDDQGYGDCSALNPQSKFQTPNIDRIAREGMVFTDGHSPDTVCTPSRYGLLTGRYAWRTELKKGVYGAEGPCLIDGGRLTIANLLKAVGYDTAMVGKWHLRMDFPGTNPSDRDWLQPTREMPLDRGFDHFYGIPASMNYGVLAWFKGRLAPVPPTLFTSKKANQIAIDDYRITPPYQNSPEGLKGQILEVAPDFDDVVAIKRFTDQSIAWLDERLQTENGNKPFLLYLPLTSPHKPVIPDSPFRGQGKAGAYGEFMIETDHHVGRILDWLDDNGLAENTLVFFSSDNGPETTWKKRIKRHGHYSSGGFRGGKRDIYEGGHRVPFLVRWPAVVAPGSHCALPVCQTDFFATLVEILGVRIAADAGEDSHSFLPALQGKPQAESALVHHASNGEFAIRKGKWKLVMGKSFESRELYDLSVDPTESKTVAAEHPNVVQQLTNSLLEIVRRGRSTNGPDVANDTGWWPSLYFAKPGAESDPGFFRAADPLKFDADIAAYKRADQASPPAPGQVLFVGSSSIRLWDTKAAFPNIRSLNRGFGGAIFDELLLYADQIVFPYKPSTIVLYCGENDIHQGWNPASTEDQLKIFLKRLKKACPGTPVIFVSAKYSLSRAALYQGIHELNQRVANLAAQTPELTFVDAATPLLGADRQPRAELFLGDRLHLNSEGYAIWQGLVSEALESVAAPVGR